MNSIYGALVVTIAATATISSAAKLNPAGTTHQAAFNLPLLGPAHIGYNPLARHAEGYNDLETRLPWESQCGK